MNLLAIETVSQTCSVCIVSSDSGSTQSFIAADTTVNGHSKVVLDLVQNVLSQAQISLPDLDFLAVNVGPGSFTGVRIGLGVTQGLAYGINKPVVPVNSLEALAWQTQSEAPKEEYILSAIDARMSQVYWGIYANGSDISSEQNVIVQPSVSSPEDMLIPESVQKSSVLLAGNGVTQYHASLASVLTASAKFQMDMAFPSAKIIADVALQRLDRSVSAAALEAKYVRNQVAVKSKSA